MSSMARAAVDIVRFNSSDTRHVALNILKALYQLTQIAVSFRKSQRLQTGHWQNYCRILLRSFVDP